VNISDRILVQSISFISSVYTRVVTSRSYISLCIGASTKKLENGFALNLRLESISCLRSEEFNADD